MYIMSKDIVDLLDRLKPVPFSKNNSQISNENIDLIKDYIEDVSNVTQTVRNVNDLNIAIKDFENSAFNIEKENRSLKKQVETKDDTIKNLNEELSAKDAKISKLSQALDKVKYELSKFNGFWRSLMKRFQTKIFDEKYYNVPKEKRSYTIVADDLANSGIFDDNDTEIINNPTKKVQTNEELAEKQAKKAKKKNDYNLN